ncbi:hypothetical protein ACS47_00470 [Bacillus cereus]|uniref:Uncharacterized protein n=1 Tax=Bacillus thuringiensis TaxID=1428 RepID=A0A9X6KRV3_BACTU|nr:hypothetical protein BT4G5_32800 [Bacillus thuringiensis serovar galleriae]EJQ96484.1 hypothetical protein II5_06066 [Bacillus cereus MSX-A1]ETE95298.1 hypothetical protein C623_0222680 [Bacillus thuringiensis serovar aizawai str. Hu4-2]KAB1377960.1 hypothetical protein FPG93_21095 [Bacillus thuringiensis]KXI83597.1 hypothetical protein ACS47_00470 [Bacillus cereus]OIX14827.1 hypothetical protein BMT18_30655 [Bacillus thuringiensis serovar aizawai]
MNIFRGIYESLFIVISITLMVILFLCCYAGIIYPELIQSWWNLIFVVIMGYLVLTILFFACYKGENLSNKSENEEEF